MDNDDQNKRSKTIELAAWGLILVTISFSFFIYFSGYFLVGHRTQSALGTFGDFWGGLLNPAFSLAAVLFFYSSLMLQRIELKSQREELELNRKSNQEILGKQNELLEDESQRDYYMAIFADIRKLENNLVSSYNDNESNITGFVVTRRVSKGIELKEFEESNILINKNSITLNRIYSYINIVVELLIENDDPRLLKLLKANIPPDYLRILANIYLYDQENEVILFKQNGLEKLINFFLDKRRYPNNVQEFMIERGENN